MFDSYWYQQKFKKYDNILSKMTGIANSASDESWVRKLEETGEWSG
jgi:hypothetical protein